MSTPVIVDSLQNADETMISRAQALQTLAELWGVEPESNALPVVGRLREVPASTPFWVLEDVRSSENGLPLEYPDAAGETLANRGVFIQRAYAELLASQVTANDSLRYFRVRLEIAEQPERIKRNNPYLLRVQVGSAELLESLPLPDDFLAVGFDKKAWVLKVVYDAAWSKSVKPVEAELEQTRNRLQGLKVDYQTEKDKQTSELNALREKQEKALELLEKKQAEENEKLALVQQQLADYQARIDDCKRWLTSYEEEKNSMSAKFERLNRYLKDRADLMLALNFIDEEEHLSLLGGAPFDDNAIANGDILNFSQDLGGDYGHAVTWIQSWMVDNNILYPRHVIENFLALLQTHDLIVLAGDSGSGKTSLVKAFAEATGSEYRIIPVKPNWTSPEDLLGYFNPLEQKFQPTPFLNALLEAKQQPDKLFLICLDEMNLARVEYYFADFLSLLEERNRSVEIDLYSDTQSGHVLAELRQVITALSSAADSEDISLERGFEQILQSESLSQKVRQYLGLAESASLLEQQGRVRKMLASVLSTPASLVFPDNVRIIGAINVDETTNYLSPKILDRAHIIKFGSPLKLDWQAIKEDIEQRREQESTPSTDQTLHFELEALGRREPYPAFSNEDDFCRFMSLLGRDYLEPLGIEFGMRAIRQGLNYRSRALKAGMTESQLRNHFIANKILPKLILDGNQTVLLSNGESLPRLEILRRLAMHLRNELVAEEIDGAYVSDVIERICVRANGLDGIVNYWS